MITLTTQRWCINLIKTVNVTHRTCSNLYPRRTHCLSLMEELPFKLKSQTVKGLKSRSSKFLWMRWRALFSRQTKIIPSEKHLPSGPNKWHLVGEQLKWITLAITIGWPNPHWIKRDRRSSIEEILKVAFAKGKSARQRCLEKVK